MNEVKEKLITEISSEIDDLASMQLGTDEYKNTVEGVTKLIDKANELDKTELDLRRIQLSEQIESNKKEKDKALDEFNKKDQLIKNAISIGGILIPVIVTVWGTYKTLNFEKTGTVTTIMGRGFINKLLPKK